MIVSRSLLSFLMLFGTLFCSTSARSQAFALHSPDGKMVVNIHLKEAVYYSVTHSGVTLLEPSSLQLQLSDCVLGLRPQLIKKEESRESNILTPLVPLKQATVSNRYNRMLLRFKGGYSVEFRAFDEGMAYRFITNRNGQVEVIDEKATFNFPDNYLLHLQETKRGYASPYEEPYVHKHCDEFTTGGKISTLPVLVDTQKGYKILISEANLTDYPALFLKGGEGFSIESTFPRYPVRQQYNGKDNILIEEEAPYMARTSGKREFPWRFLVVAERDAQLVENTMVCKLSEPSRLADTKWIEPGQTVWDWWNYAVPYGVDFVAGRNQLTYKYFIDFAARHHIPYTLIDDGWAKSRKEPFDTNPDVDMPELLAYAKAKGVKVILWMHWTAVENHMDTLFKKYKEWGVAGLKIDFMARSDQWMVNFYERVAREAAANHMIVLFHGSFKPAGLEYLYPNILSYEGVRGLEWKGACTPDNNIYLPFMRNAVGPMDFTPGSMVSMQPEHYVTSSYNPAAVGTRTTQLAHFILFESGIQMLADNPTRYDAEKACFEFINRIPVTWDETRVLEASVGQYVLVAKRKGDKWFVGGITNSSEEGRKFQVPLSFLNKGKKYVMTSFEDGINADKVAMDYRKEERSVGCNDSITVRMVKNGGWAAVFE